MFADCHYKWTVAEQFLNVTQTLIHFAVGIYCRLEDHAVPPCTAVAPVRRSDDLEGKVVGTVGAGRIAKLVLRRLAVCGLCSLRLVVNILGDSSGLTCSLFTLSQLDKDSCSLTLG